MNILSEILDFVGKNYGVIEVSKSAISSLPTTITNSRIKARHVVIAHELSDPSAQTGDWTVTTSDGSLTISGSISGSTNIKLSLGYKTN